MSNFLPKNWFVATVRPRSEAAVARGLEERNLKPFSPTCSVIRQWSDRKRTLKQPLFPGYVFCHFGRQDRASVLSTPGVRSIIGFGGEPAVVPEVEVEQIAALVASGRPLQRYPYLTKGQVVRIERGPLRGVEGIVIETEDDCRLVVSVTLLQRSVAVKFDADDVAPEANPIHHFARAFAGQ